jgi:hypothetical protein
MACNGKNVAVSCIQLNFFVPEVKSIKFLAGKSSREVSIVAA